MPKEKYSPLLLVLMSYFRPFSVFTHSTIAPTIGLPSTSLQTPFTLPVSCAKAGLAHSPATNMKSANTTKYCFIVVASRSNLNVRFKILSAENVARISSCYENKTPLALRLFYDLAIGDQILGASLLKGSETQHTTIAHAASAIFTTVTRPR